MSHNLLFGNKNVGSGENRDSQGRGAHAFRKLVLDAVRMHMRQHPVEIRPIIKDGIESALGKILPDKQWKNGNKIHPSCSRRSLQLRFLSSISDPVYTKIPIEVKDKALGVALVDSFTGEEVTYGPMASAKVEIVLLDKEFSDDDDAGNWTSEQFDSKIVREKEGNKLLLKGDTTLNLSGGIGVVGKIYFRYARRAIKCCKLRLGARMVDLSDQTLVREAKTEPFILKDHRAMPKKKYPPSPSDEVWRLEKISKYGVLCKRLRQEGIITVKDFLSHHKRLRHILGKAMNNKMWAMTLKHAQMCNLDPSMSLHAPLDDQENDGMECHFGPIDNPSETQEEDVHKLVKSACKGVLYSDHDASAVHGCSKSSNPPHPLNLATSDSPDACSFSASNMFAGFEHARSLVTDSAVHAFANTNTLDDNCWESSYGNSQNLGMSSPILGKGINNEMSAATWKRAQACEPDPNMSLPNLLNNQKNYGMEWQFGSIPNLSETQEDDVHNVKFAYDGVVHYDHDTSAVHGCSLSSNPYHLNSATPESPNASSFSTSTIFSGYEHSQPSVIDSSIFCFDGNGLNYSYGNSSNQFTNFPDINMHLYYPYIDQCHFYPMLNLSENQESDVVTSVESASKDGTFVMHESSQSANHPYPSNLVTRVSPISNSSMFSGYVPFADDCDSICMDHIHDVQSLDPILSSQFLDTDQYILKEGQEKICDASRNARVRWTKIFSILKWFFSGKRVHATDK